MKVTFLLEKRRIVSGVCETAISTSREISLHSTVLFIKKVPDIFFVYAGSPASYKERRRGWIREEGDNHRVRALSPFFSLRFICASPSFSPFLPPSPPTIARGLIFPGCYRLAAVIGCYIRGGDINYYHVRVGAGLASPHLRRLRAASTAFTHIRQQWEKGQPPTRPGQAKSLTKKIQTLTLLMSAISFHRVLSTSSVSRFTHQFSRCLFWFISSEYAFVIHAYALNTCGKFDRETTPDGNIY